MHDIERAGGHGIESVDYANTTAKNVGVRTFRQSVPRLSYDEMEKVYRTSGVLRKGINKKARDAIRKGFILKPDEDDTDDEHELNAAMRGWMRDTAYKAKAIKALRDMYVFGDGFLELGYDEPRGTSSMDAPARNAEVVKVFDVDPLHIRPVKDPENGEIVAYLSGEGVRDIPFQTVKAWARGRRGELPKGIKAVHPDRIDHYQVNTIRSDKDGYGIGVIEAAYINALAKLAGDLSAGDVLEWYAKGFFVLNIDYASPEELKQARRQMEAAKEARKNYFVGSERHNFDIKSPLIANVKPFYDNFYIELAGALEMPVMVLLGVQKGSVTGSEVDLVEYYDDIASLQELLLEAPLMQLAQRVLKRSDFSIKWQVLYVNKQTEADIRFKDAQSASQLYGSGILSRREAIQFLRNNGELPVAGSVPDGYGEKGQVAGPDTPEGDDPPERDDKDDSFSDLPEV